MFSKFKKHGATSATGDGTGDVASTQPLRDSSTATAPSPRDTDPGSGLPGTNQQYNSNPSSTGTSVRNPDATRQYQGSNDTSLQGHQDPQRPGHGAHTLAGGQGYTSSGGGDGTSQQHPAAGRGYDAPNVPGHGHEAQGPNQGTLNTGNGGYHSARMVYSQSLMAQSEAKEREAAALHKQGLEILEAEKLEKAAMAARERAVEHGAHPAHGPLGSR